MRWAARELLAWEVACDTGPSIGRIDIVAIRDFGGGDLASRSEVVAIEVKRKGQPFVKSAGQAHGYSVMADRCYLAQQCAGFSAQDQVVASRLGIGLLAIDAGSRVRQVSTAPLQEPLPELRLKLLEKLRCGACALCSTIFRLGQGSSRYKNVRRAEHSGMLARAADDVKGLMWWLSTTAGERDRSAVTSIYWRRYLCPDCVQALAPDA